MKFKKLMDVSMNISINAETINIPPFFVFYASNTYIKLGKRI